MEQTFAEHPGESAEGATYSSNDGQSFSITGLRRCSKPGKCWTNVSSKLPSAMSKENSRATAFMGPDLPLSEESIVRAPILSFLMANEKRFDFQK